MSKVGKTQLNRRSFLVGSLAAGAVGPLMLSACSSAGSPNGDGKGGTLNWLTWADHFSNEQLSKVDSSTGIKGQPKLLSDNAEGFLQVKQTGSQFDLVSGDGLWVPKYKAAGLIEAFDLGSIGASSELFSLAKNFKFLNDSSGAIGYPFSWSTVQMYYDPAKVRKAPTSWESLTDPAYKGLIVAENNATDLMAIAALATGSKSPYEMTPDQISSASGFLTALKPNIVKLVGQNNELVSMLASGEAAIAIANLGSDLRVKEASGPTLTGVYPTEGTIGFIDAEMITAQGQDKKLTTPFLDAMERSEFIVANFKANYRPLFNEAAAKILLNDPKTAEDAKRLFMDDPEKALATTLKGPAQDQQAYTESFNRVFGA